MRRPPPPHPRGAPRTPGSGRRRGTPNRSTVEMRALMASLCHDVDYQYRLRADFRRRRVHPSIEALVWAHAVGKPAEKVVLSADMTVNRKLDEERELFQKLSVQQLEELAAESQALVDKARAMVRANGVPHDPTTAARAPLQHGASADVVGPVSTGTAARAGDRDLRLRQGDDQARVLPVGGSPSLASAVDDVATSGPAEPSTASAVADPPGTPSAETDPRRAS